MVKLWTKSSVYVARLSTAEAISRKRSRAEYEGLQEKKTVACLVRSRIVVAELGVSIGAAVTPRLGAVVYGWWGLVAVIRDGVLGKFPPLFLRRS